MHELSICQSLLRQVENIAMEHNARSVTAIFIAMGPLSGVEAQLLKSAYPVASAGTIAEQAELVIEYRPVRIKCEQCSKETDAEPNKLICQHCGGRQTTLLSGDELILINVELEKKALH